MSESSTESTATCSLSPDALGDRVSAWRQLARTALQRRARPGYAVTTYPNTPETLERLRQLIDAERDCCSFLGFDVHEERDSIVVELRYPPEFGPLLASVIG